MASELNSSLRSAGGPLDHEYSLPAVLNGTGHMKSASSGTYHMNDVDVDRDAALKKIKTVGSLAISPELFEKIYLSPQNAVKGDLRKTFGNPTPIALAGLVIAITPLSIDFMGWFGAGTGGVAASTGAFFWFGGLLMLIGGLLEFVLGNTFPSVVFCSYSAFWITLAATLVPETNAINAYATPGKQTGGLSEGFNASFAMLMMCMAFLSALYFVCSLRTNIVYAIIFLCLILGFGALTASYLCVASAQNLTEMSHNLDVGAGVALFIASLATWYIFAAIMLATLDFPFQIPVGDLSNFIKGTGVKDTEDTV